MTRFVVLLCLFIFSECAEDEREPKFFFGQKAQTVVSLRKVPEFVTEFIPSSCIVVEPTLPPCRHVRNLEIYPSIPTRITKTQLPQIQNAQPVEPQKWKPLPQSSEVPHHIPTPPLRVRPQHTKTVGPNWNWNLLNLFRVPNVTYTTTKTEYVTTRIEDPNTVVSFYVKGCRPSKLPFNLPECSKPEEVAQHEEEEEKSVVIMAPLKFVTSVDSIIPSKTGNVVDIPKEEQKTDKNQSNAEGQQN